MSTHNQLTRASSDMHTRPHVVRHYKVVFNVIFVRKVGGWIGQYDDCFVTQWWQFQLVAKLNTSKPSSEHPPQNPLV